ncbi:MAG: hypothetical protein E7643_04330 [Ruminococcaceae bacterium]|nr:hypothetical protein [Oscillospiraceae bacterium]
MNPQSENNIPAQMPELPPPSGIRPTGEGYLIVHVTTARGSIPLEGALVTLRDYVPEPTEGRGDALITTVSGRDGNTERLTLPAPSRTESLTPGFPSPFAVYNLEVQLEGYRGQSYIALPIFEGITAVQPVDMIPLSENGRIEARRPTEDRFYETEPQNL